MTQRAAEGCEGRWDREREIGQAADRSNEGGGEKYTGNGGKQQTRKNIAKLVKSRQKGNPQIPDSLANEINQKLLKTNQERKYNIQKNREHKNTTSRSFSRRRVHGIGRRIGQ
jgi:hypothetical protein